MKFHRPSGAATALKGSKMTNQAHSTALGTLNFHAVRLPASETRCVHVVAQSAAS